MLSFFFREFQLINRSFTFNLQYLLWAEEQDSSL